MIRIIQGFGEASECWPLLEYVDRIFYSSVCGNGMEFQTQASKHNQVFDGRFVGAKLPIVHLDSAVGYYNGIDSVNDLH